MIEAASTDAASSAAKPIGAGALMRTAREAQGLHIAALAAAIKVSPRKLDALENDRWTELPDATFTRALAQTVCRTLKIDARPVLALLPAVSTAGFDATGATLNTPFRERSGRDDTGIASTAIRPMVWAGLVLMAAAVVVYLLPEGLLTRSAPPDTQPNASTTVAPASVATPALPASAAASASAASVETASTADVQPSPAPVETPVQPRAGQDAAAAPATAASGAGAGAVVVAAGPVQLRTSEASWIGARDARGQVLLSRTVLPGESIGLDGSLPIRLTIGNAAVTRLSFRGQPVDLGPSTRDNVARLELQ